MEHMIFVINLILLFFLVKRMWIGECRVVFQFLIADDCLNDLLFLFKITELYFEQGQSYILNYWADHWKTINYFIGLSFTWPCFTSYECLLIKSYVLPAPWYRFSPMRGRFAHVLKLEFVDFHQKINCLPLHPHLGHYRNQICQSLT